MRTMNASAYFLLDIMDIGKQCRPISLKVASHLGTGDYFVEWESLTAYVDPRASELG